MIVISVQSYRYLKEMFAELLLQELHGMVKLLDLLLITIE